MNWKQIEKRLQKMDWRKLSVGAAIVALTLIAVSVWNLARQGYVGSGSSFEVDVADAATTIRHPLTGAFVDQEIEPPAVYAVMVENSSDAWPQSGVDRAFQVIEAPTEGGIPRFLALFAADQEVDEIGPVRSARPYFIDWASGYGALYAHVGGSPSAIKQLNVTETVLDFDEYYNQYQFWRAPVVPVPHNVFTSTELLGKGLNKSYPDKSDWAYEIYTFKDDLVLEDRPENVEDTVVEFGADVYRVIWKYDRLSNSYERWENTWAQVTTDGVPLSARNVVVIATEMTVLDEIGRLAIVTTGEGEALLIQDGAVKDISWKKLTVTDALKFYYDDGTEISLNAGQTWIEVVEEF